MADLLRWLTDPFVLRCAVMKVLTAHPGSLYGTTAHRARLAADPWTAIRDLADFFGDHGAGRLAAAMPSPEGWTMEPGVRADRSLRTHIYPPQALDLRVTTMAVLLGPIIERRLESHVYGNRWFRALIRRSPRSRVRSQWEDLPYSLGDTRAYVPWRRSHGLYLRNARWIVEQARTDGAPHDDPEDEEELRGRRWAFVTDDRTVRSEDGSLYWAQLDLKSAYLSVDLDRLKERLIEVVAWDPIQRDDLAYAENGPWKKLEEDREARIGLASAIAASIRLPKGLPDELPDPPAGLATGFTAAGLLFNVYLTPWDREIARIAERHGGAVLRYVDEFVFIAPTPSTLREMLDGLRGLSDDPHLSPVNTRKTLPSGLADEVIRVSADDKPRPPWEWEEDWLAQHSRLDPEDPEPFYSALGESLSQLDALALQDLYGPNVAYRHRRLTELLELASSPLVDAEAVRAFAAYRLSWAPLPSFVQPRWREGQPIQENELELRKVAERIERVLQAAPHRGGLWAALWRVVARLATHGRSLWLNALAQRLGAPRWLERGLKKHKVQDQAVLAPLLRRMALHTLLSTVLSLHRFGRRVRDERLWDGRHWAAPLMPASAAPKAAATLLEIGEAIAELWPGELPPPIRRRQELGRIHQRSHWLRPEGSLHLLSMTNLSGSGRAEVLAEFARPEEGLRLAQRLGCAHHLPREVVERWATAECEVLARTDNLRRPTDLMRWMIRYGRARRAVLSLGYRQRKLLRPAWSWAARTWALACEPPSRRLRPSSDDLSVILGLHNGTPASIGLPPRLVLRALKESLGDEARLTLAMDWRLTSDASAVANQILRDELSGPEVSHANHLPERVLRPGRAHLPPHPLFLLLGTPAFMAPEKAREIAHHCIALVAATGSERELDSLFRTWPAPRPFAVAQRARGALPEPQSFWQSLDRALGANTSWSAFKTPLGQDLEPAPDDGPPPNDAISVIEVDLDDEGWPEGLLAGVPQPDPTTVGWKPPEEGLHLAVRVAQTDYWPTKAEIKRAWPRHPHPLPALWNITQALPTLKAGEGAPDIVVLPEVVLPVGVEHLLCGTVRRYRYGVLVGRYWRPIGPSPWTYRDRDEAPVPRRFVNEALFVAPFRRRSHRMFRIVKPTPAAVEYGIARALSSAPDGAR